MRLGGSPSGDAKFVNVILLVRGSSRGIDAGRFDAQAIRKIGLGVHVRPFDRYFQLRWNNIDKRCRTDNRRISAHRAARRSRYVLVCAARMASTPETPRKVLAKRSVNSPSLYTRAEASPQGSFD